MWAASGVISTPNTARCMSNTVTGRPYVMFHTCRQPSRDPAQTQADVHSWQTHWGHSCSNTVYQINHYLLDFWSDSTTVWYLILAAGVNWTLMTSYQYIASVIIQLHVALWLCR